MISYVRRLAELASADPDRPAVTCGAETISRRELDLRSNALARHMKSMGVGEGDFVTMAMRNSVTWMVTAVAIWKLGAVLQPVSFRAPLPELRQVVELVQPALVVGVDTGLEFPCLPADFAPGPDVSTDPLPDIVSPAWKAPTSGGSTGKPKVILAGSGAELAVDTPPPWKFSHDGCVVIPGPLYHNGPASFALRGLLWGNHIVVLPKFDAEGTMLAVEEHRADVLYLVPTMMKRITKLGSDWLDALDLSSLRVVWHMAEPCPVWLKREWIDWLGPDRIMELYSSTEAQLVLWIDGHEWLEHQGSVGRPEPGRVSIRDADGAEVAQGEVGEIWIRRTETVTYRYLGAEVRRSDDGLESLGDMGYLDEGGFLYLADRTSDLIIRGGSNVYAAEVEAALAEHPAVLSCVVIGLPDDDQGQLVHALIESSDPELTGEALVPFLLARLVPYKVPQSWEFVSEPLIDEAGKVRRAQLRSERLR
jgi:bile acid-coenzyme A ligase